MIPSIKCSVKNCWKPKVENSHFCKKHTVRFNLIMKDLRKSGVIR